MSSLPPTHDHVAGSFLPGGSVLPVSVSSTTSDHTVEEDAHGKTGFYGGQWEYRGTKDRLVLDLPAGNVRRVRLLTLLIGFNMFSGFVAMAYLAAWSGAWQRASLLVLFCSLPVAFFVLLIGRARRECTRPRRIIVEPTRLLVEKGPRCPEQFDEEELLADSTASIGDWNWLAIHVGHRSIALCATLSAQDGDWICGRINTFLDKHSADRPVYIERPIPTERGFACDVDGDRLTLTFPRLGLDWMIMRFVGAAYITALMIGGLMEDAGQAGQAANRPGMFVVVGVFGSAALYYLWTAFRDRFARVQAIVEPSRLTVARELFGMRTEKEFPLDESSRAEVTLHGRGMSTHCVVTISPAGKAGRFGKLMGDDDRDWIASRINEHFRQCREALSS